MTPGQYLRMVLIQDPGVAALAGDRVYSEVLPQAPRLPAVVFIEVSAEEDYSLDGPTGVRALRFQVDSWAVKREEATALGLAVRAVLSGHAGAAGGLAVHGVLFLAERWEFETETDLYRTSQDYEIVATP